MFFFSQKTIGWVLIVLGALISGFCLWGVLSGRAVETRDTGIKLIFGGVGMVALGVVCNLVFNRKK